MQGPSLHGTPVSAISNHFSSSPKATSPVKPIPSFQVNLPNASKPSKPEPKPENKLSGSGVIVIDDANDILMKEDALLDALVPDDVELNSVLSERVFPTLHTVQDAQPSSDVVPVSANPAPGSVVNVAPTSHPTNVMQVVPAAAQDPASVSQPMPVNAAAAPSLFDGGIRMDMLPDVPTQAPIAVGPSVINVHYSNNNKVAVVSDS